MRDTLKYMRKRTVYITALVTQNCITNARWHTTISYLPVYITALNTQNALKMHADMQQSVTCLIITFVLLHNSNLNISAIRNTNHI